MLPAPWPAGRRARPCGADTNADPSGVPVRLRSPRALSEVRSGLEGVVASTGADVAATLSAAVGALSGPLHGGEPSRVLSCSTRSSARLTPSGEFWSAVVLDHADVPADLFTSLFIRVRNAGWSAHVLVQKREGRLIRPSAQYVGPPPRPLPSSSCSGAAAPVVMFRVPEVRLPAT